MGINGMGIPMPMGLPEVEFFLQQNPVEPHAASRLRALPPDMQRVVMQRGSLQGARNPSAVIISRIRDASNLSLLEMGGGVLPAAFPHNGPVHPGVEMLIARYGLDARCAQTLRSLPPEKQAMAAELPMHEARNPSAYVMAHLQAAEALPAPMMNDSGSFPGNLQAFMAGHPPTAPMAEPVGRSMFQMV